MPTPARQFLSDAGLPHDAAAADIRRAYARRLKQLDPAAEPGAFQHLREGYEAAYAQASAEPVADTARAPNNDAARALAQGVTQAIGSRDAVEQQLVATLDDARLQEIEAREAFESAIVDRLAQGWRPGHEHLFAAAIDVFGWDCGAPLARRFGPSGVLLDAAIGEMQAFNQLAFGLRLPAHALLRALRSDARPPDRFLRRHLALAEQCQGLFPQWMHVVSRPAQLGSWRERARRLPRRRYVLMAKLLPRLTAPAPGRPGGPASRHVGWRLALAALLGLAVLARMLPGDAAPSEATLVPGPSDFSAAPAAGP